MHNFILHTVFSPANPPDHPHNQLSEAQRRLLTPSDKMAMSKMTEQKLLDDAFGQGGWHWFDVKSNSCHNNSTMWGGSFSRHTMACSKPESNHLGENKVKVPGQEKERRTTFVDSKNAPTLHKILSALDTMKAYAVANHLTRKGYIVEPELDGSLITTIDI